MSMVKVLVKTALAKFLRTFKNSVTRALWRFRPRSVGGGSAKPIPCLLPCLSLFLFLLLPLLTACQPSSLSSSTQPSTNSPFSVPLISSPSSTSSLQPTSNQQKIEAFWTDFHQLLSKHQLHERQVSFSFEQLSPLPLRLNFQEQQPRLAASTIKVPLAIWTLEEVAEGEFSLQTPLSYTADAYRTGSGILQYEPPGQSYPLKELLRLSIVESDNVATQLIYNWLSVYGGENARLALQKHFSLPENPEINQTTADDMLRILQGLEENPKQNPFFPLLLQWMQAAKVSYLQLAAQSSATPSPSAPIFYAHKHGTLAGVYSELALYHNPSNQQQFRLAIYLDLEEAEPANWGEQEMKAQLILSEMGQLFLKLAETP